MVMGLWQPECTPDCVLWTRRSPEVPGTGGLKDCLTEVLSTIYEGGGSSRLLEYMCGRSETLDYSGLPFKRVHCTTHCLRLYLVNSAILKYSTRASPPILPVCSCVFWEIAANGFNWELFDPGWWRCIIACCLSVWSYHCLLWLSHLYYLCLFSLTWQYMCMVLYCVCMYIPTCTVAIWLLLWWASFRVWLIDWLIDWLIEKMAS